MTHASPAAAYAHSADRKWEADADMPRHGLRCEDIASQLVKGRVGSNIDVSCECGSNTSFDLVSLFIEAVVVQWSSI